MRYKRITAILLALLMITQVLPLEQFSKDLFAASELSISKESDNKIKGTSTPVVTTTSIITTSTPTTASSPTKRILTMLP